jgi:hypothetical protein
MKIAMNQDGKEKGELTDTQSIHLQNVGRELGIQVWALHPTIRGSNPRRSTTIYTKSFGGLQ